MDQATGSDGSVPKAQRFEGFPSTAELNAQTSEKYVASGSHPGHINSKFEYEQRNRELLMQLSSQTGMPMYQINGQRYTGPPRDYFGPPPPKGSEIYVRRLPLDCFEPELLAIFQTAGHIYSIRLMMNLSGRNRGYCFVMYFTPEAATNAIEVLNGYEIRPGLNLEISRSVDNRRLYISNLPKGMGLDEVYTELNGMTAGVVCVLSEVVASRRKGAENSAIVEYDSHRNASLALALLLKGNAQIKGSPIVTDWAKPERDGQFLLLENVPSSLSDEQLLEVLNSSSSNGVDAMNRDGLTAAVHFFTFDQTAMAHQAFLGIILHGNSIKVTWQQNGDFPKVTKSKKVYKRYRKKERKYRHIPQLNK